MATRSSGGYADQSANIFMAPGIAFATWNQFLTGVLNPQANPFLAGVLNPDALGDLRTMADEWQGFWSRRLKEDIALLERLTRSTAPDQVISAYADFWHKAGEDYGNEITTMTKLMTGMTSKVA